MDNVQLTIEQKVELAKWIVDNNSSTAITGSMFLWSLGIDTGREPQDIDILVRRDLGDFRRMLIMPPFTKELHIENVNGYSVASKCMFLGTKIDFILAEDYQSNYFYDDVILVKDILEAKKRYLLSDSHKASKEKHAKDIEVIEEWLDKNKESIRN